MDNMESVVGVKLRKMVTAETRVRGALDVVEWLRDVKSVACDGLRHCPDQGGLNFTEKSLFEQWRNLSISGLFLLLAGGSLEE
ncbi:MAG: hypothetical protein EAZ81_10820 [Verrucomicrobia bacterium]|nr:MAG: hypothetical protein EAZ81_10820 [Verrucomicrobiota bacterium]